MKKLFLILTCLLSCILLCSCTNKLVDQQVDSDDSRANNIESTNVTIDQEEGKNYALYEPDVYDSSFNIAIKNNKIDAAYDKDINLATTTDELVQVELKYISMWEAELDSSIKKYTSVLSDEDRLAFQASQDLFEEYYKASTSYDADMLLYGKYGINLGTSSTWLLYINKKEIIKERTFHIKYLHFLLERAQENPEVFASLVFEAE